MSVFETLSAKLISLKDNRHELLQTNILLWENWMLLTTDQFKEVVAQLKKTEKLSAQAKCWYMLSEGLFYTFNSSLGNAFEKLSETAEAFRAINDKGGEGAAQSLQVIYFKNNGQLDKAQEYVQHAIFNLGEDKSYVQFLCVTYYQAGEMHHLQKDYDAAIKFFTTGLKHSKEDTAIHLRLLVGLGTVYRDTNELDKAFDLFQKTLKQLEGKNNNTLESKIYADIGNYYYLKEEFDNAFLYQQKSIDIRLKHNLKSALITNYIELAELYLKQHKLEEALTYVLQSETLAKELKIIIKLNQVYLIMSTIYEAMGDPLLALDYYKKYHQTKEEVFSQESARKIKQLSMRHDMEKVEQEKELFKLRNVVLKEALNEIEASVRYAQRLQDAILPSLNSIRKKLPNTFVLYKPKDIVAGDFYWMEEIDNNILIAAADCTGHGVPGAMVSVVCCNALHRAVHEFDLRDTGKILDKTRELVLQTFAKSNEEIKDGMDISMCHINTKTNQIQWSGANNPLWYIKNGGTEMLDIKANKQPIGKTDNPTPFTTHTTNLQKNDTLYLMTDGYPDQFGGEKGKKFKYKQLQELLVRHSGKGLEEQKNILTKTFDDWKGNLEQVDDVTIIGIRL